ncbi:lipid-A-disaccharide synthase [Parachlamydia sp. AcF125]|uniref:lipid-A-disaccharide synthase n=1 Tax=Parachlamydia sp. AcF125 TaxID=2795736 RepID=UPI001BC93A47|nr:lipid-A-disaccharide synthase [Parachlamydia sp. AcF125]MBS4168021.1 Lipid-A-disaccharide synthase [Parachlamydia sp. AcF125]
MNLKQTSIFFFAGEQSGDLHGQNLLQNLRQKLPGYAFTGVGGPLMRPFLSSSILKMEDFEVMGFSDVLRALPKLIRQFYQVRNAILDTQPAAVVLIDYPGFNLRLAKSLRKKGYKGKIAQYICPSVWAWGKERIEHMANTLDLLLSILPFEKELFSHTPLHVEYIGNPLLTTIKGHSYHPHWIELLGIKPAAQLIALFPGSRKGEIQRNLPIQLKVAQLMRREDRTFALSCAHPGIIPVMQSILEETHLKLHRDIFLVPKAYTYELMKDSHAAIAKSGTVTLELALHQRPSTVIYQLTALNRFIAKYILRLNLPYYSIANILAQKQIFPELIATGLTPKNVYAKMEDLSNPDSANRQMCIQNCRDLIPLLAQKSHPFEQATQAILEMLEEKSG